MQERAAIWPEGKNKWQESEGRQTNMKTAGRWKVEKPKDIAIGTEDIVLSSYNTGNKP